MRDKLDCPEELENLELEIQVCKVLEIKTDASIRIARSSLSYEEDLPKYKLLSLQCQI